MHDFVRLLLNQKEEYFPSVIDNRHRVCQMRFHTVHDIFRGIESVKTQPQNIPPRDCRKDNRYRTKHREVLRNRHSHKGS